MAVIIDGKLVSKTIRESIKDDVAVFKSERNITP